MTDQYYELARRVLTGAPTANSRLSFGAGELGLVRGDVDAFAAIRSLLDRITAFRLTRRGEVWHGAACDESATFQLSRKASGRVYQIDMRLALGEVDFWNVLPQRILQYSVLLHMLADVMSSKSAIRYSPGALVVNVAKIKTVEADLSALLDFVERYPKQLQSRSSLIIKGAAVRRRLCDYRLLNFEILYD